MMSKHCAESIVKSKESTQKNTLLQKHQHHFINSQYW